MLVGCSSSAGPAQIRRCVDDQGNVLPDSACEQRRGYYRGGMYHYPGWGYGGAMQGNTLRNFSSTPSADADVITPSGRTISRGGFGRSGSGFSGFG
jgi:hypothetical protein